MQMIKTANQNVKPITYRKNSHGNAQIGGCDVVELVREFKTPLLIYDEATIRSVTGDFKRAFFGTEIHPMYAAKAFMTKAICKIMQSEGFGLDCVSGGELYTAKSAGFDMSNIVFNGSNKSREELEFALDNGVGTVSVDNFYEASLLNEIAFEKGINQKIFLRLTPGIECHTHEYIKTGHLDSKFGFDLTQVDEILSLIKNEYSNLDLKGLHVHLGSQIFETRVWHDAIEVLFREAARIRENFGFNLSEFNVGGGPGIKYVEEDEPVSIYKIADVIKSAVAEFAPIYGIKNPVLYTEPGRCIVGTAGVAVYTVGSSKVSGVGKKYVAIDGGMADNIRPALYGAQYCVETVNAKPDAKLEKVDIAGRFCESGDIAAKDVLLPEPEPGDLIAFFAAGAYGYSMASNYNRVPKPAVVLVKDGNVEVIVRRESFEDLVKFDEIPTTL